MKKPMVKKSLLSVAIALAVLTSFASCGSDDASKEASSPSTESSTVSTTTSADASEGASVVPEQSEEISDSESGIKFETTVEDELEDTELVLYVNNNDVDADSYWYFYYGDDSAKVKVYVKDPAVMKGDGVMAYVGVCGKDASFEDGKAVYITALVDGTVTAKGYENGTFSKDLDIVSTIEGWKFNDMKGYAVTLEVPYEALGVDSETAYSNLGIAPGLSNCNGKETTSEFSKGFNCVPGLANGLIKVIDDDTYEANPFSGVVNLGAATSDIQATGNWDTTADYAESDAKYADRKVVLNGDGTNTIYFTGKTSPVLYAEGIFKVSAIKNGDAWPKFGIMFNDGADTGLFCFIDAGTGDSSKTELTDIFSDNAGYVHVRNGLYMWTETEKIDWPTGWTYDQAIKLGVLRNGDTVTFYVNGAETYVITDIPSLTADSECSVGFNVFNMDLEITDYRCIDDVNDPVLKDLLSK